MVIGGLGVLVVLAIVMLVVWIAGSGKR